MIYLGYIGQFYENKDEAGPLIIFGVIGCVFYIIMLAIVIQCVNHAKTNLKTDTGKYKMQLVAGIFIVFWTIYPIILTQICMDESDAAEKEEDAASVVAA